MGAGFLVEVAGRVFEVSSFGSMSLIVLSEFVFARVNNLSLPRLCFVDFGDQEADEEFWEGPLQNYHVLWDTNNFCLDMLLIFLVVTNVLILVLWFLQTIFTLTIVLLSLQVHISSSVPFTLWAEPLLPTTF